MTALGPPCQNVTPYSSLLQPHTSFSVCIEILNKGVLLQKLRSALHEKVVDGERLTKRTVLLCVCVCLKVCVWGCVCTVTGVFVYSCMFQLGKRLTICLSKTLTCSVQSYFVPLTYHFPKRIKWHWLRPVHHFYNLMFTFSWLIQQCLAAQHLWLPVTPFVNPS
jgi:hypothetical protein